MLRIQTAAFLITHLLLRRFDGVLALNETFIPRCGDCWCFPNDVSQCPAFSPGISDSFPADFAAAYASFSLVGTLPNLVTTSGSTDCYPFADLVGPQLYAASNFPQCVRPQNNDTTVCGYKFAPNMTCVGRSYEMISYPSMAALQTDGAVLAHSQACGVCSSATDFSTRLNNLETLDGAATVCATKFLLNQTSGFGTLISCFEALGFTRPCAALWGHFSATNAALCALPCLQSTVPNLPNCELGPCLSCSATSFQVDFDVLAGRTLQNSGITEPIARPCNVFTRVEHDPCAGALQSVPPTTQPTTQPTMEPTSHSSMQLTMSPQPTLQPSSEPSTQPSTALTPEPTSSFIPRCGDCWCFPDDGSACPPYSPGIVDTLPIELGSIYDSFTSVGSSLALETADGSPNCFPFAELLGPQGSIYPESLFPQCVKPAGTASSVCGYKFAPTTTCRGRPYDAVTYESLAALEADGAVLAHAQACGVCSSAQDFGARIKNLGSIERDSVICAAEYQLAGRDFGRLTTCYENLGFSRSCATLWAHFAATNAVRCATSCIPNQDLEVVLNNPDCTLAKCLECSLNFQVEFDVLAGRTLQNSGITEAIARPCNVFTRVEHDPCVGAPPAGDPTPAPTPAPTSKPSGSLARLWSFSLWLFVMLTALALACC